MLWLHGRPIFATLLLPRADLPDLCWLVLGRLFESKAVSHAAARSHLEILLLADSYSGHRLFIPGYVTESIKSAKRDPIITKKRGRVHLRRELLIKSQAVER